MIIIFDFGSQTTHLIKRRFNRLGIKTKIASPEDALTQINRNKPRAIVLSGGPASVYGDGSPKIDKRIFELKIPILGICYGLQLITYLLKGRVKPGSNEFGPEILEYKSNNLLFKELPKKIKVWMSHGDEVITLPKGFEVIASTKKTKNSAIANEKKKIYGVQFHPEIYHTQEGDTILKNFAELSGLSPKKTTINIQELLNKTALEYERLGKGKVIAAVSGGVDSTVASVITAKVVGKNFVPIYCDTGLMRYNTTQIVKNIFKNELGLNIKIIRGQKEFFSALKGVVDPEKKRKIIGNLFVKFFEREAKKHKDINILMQGTIYSDIVETGRSTKKASKIKTHHNVGGLPKNMKLKILEPLKDFYKDEVREIGRRLGLSEEVVSQQPFPGPGYAIRILGEVTAERVKKVKKIDKILNNILKKEGIYEKIFQSFPVLTGVKSTAVKGDARVYAEVVALRIFESTDVMSADWARLSYSTLDKIVREITTHVPDVSRVVYDITTKPPATMEWE